MTSDRKMAATGPKGPAEREEYFEYIKEIDIDDGVSGGSNHHPPPPSGNPTH